MSGERVTRSARYLYGLLETIGIVKEGKVDLRWREKRVRKFNDKQWDEYLTNIDDYVTTYYNNNAKNMLQDLKNFDGQKCILFTRSFPFRMSEPIVTETFLRKASLYFDKIVMPDPVEPFALQGISQVEYRQPPLLVLISRWARLWPWVHYGLVDFLPSSLLWGDQTKMIAERAASQDAEDEEWRTASLRDEDEGLDGEEEVLTAYEDYFRANFPENTFGEPRKAVTSAWTFGSSFDVCRCLMHSVASGCWPATESNRMYRLLGTWLKHKSDLVDNSYALKKQSEQTKDASAFLSLEALNLGFLENLSPEQIRKLKNSSEYRFRDFRRKWTQTCSDLRNMPFQEGFQAEANQLWNEKIIPEVNRIDKDLKAVRMKLGTSVGLSSIGIVTAFVPNLTFIGLLTSVVSLLVPGLSIPEALQCDKQVKTDQKNNVYFLVASKRTPRKPLHYKREKLNWQKTSPL